MMEASPALVRTCDPVFGRTPLHIAAQHLDARLVAWLLDHDAEPKAPDRRGHTPLDHAAHWSGEQSAARLAEVAHLLIVDHTFRDPEIRGCGTGDIRFMLESKNLGGKCADLNSLFVGLARASRIPARDVFGIRVAPSQSGRRSLGLSSPIATRAQHCRAEVYLTGYGWVPVDPADVRKVALEEPPGHLAMDDDKVRTARQALFGSWEMNWVAFNMAHDVVLPGSKRRPLAYFMYPQAETANGRLDSLDPDAFRYEIIAREL